MAEIQNGVTTLCPKLSIEAVLTVVPHKPTDPRVPRKIMVENTSCGIYRRRFQMILCYKKTLMEDELGWLVTGRMKESLGEMLSDQPLFAGRVRRVEGGGDGELEIVPNDSGVRFLKTRVSMSLEEFLNLDDKKEVEAQLVHWEDIDAENPQYAPLFYIQVTNFGCGRGYSVGISCSLLLADPLAMTSFLTDWTKYHNTIFSKHENHNRPLFDVPSLGERKFTPYISAIPLNSIPTSTSSCKNLIFKFALKDLTDMDSDKLKAIAVQCIEEAEHKFGHKLSSTNFSLLMKVKSLSSSSEDVVIKVDNFVKQKLLVESSLKVMNVHGLTSKTSWDSVLQVDRTTFDGGNQPVLVACWINCIVDEGMVVVISSPDERNFGNIVIVIVLNE